MRREWLREHSEVLRLANDGSKSLGAYSATVMAIFAPLPAKAATSAPAVPPPASIESESEAKIGC
jgi:hypothetical protein